MEHGLSECRRQSLHSFCRTHQSTGQPWHLRRPNHVVVRSTDPELFRCPFLLMSEVGAAYFDEDDVARLREYFLKGGFLWVDDFWGSDAWNVWEEQISKVFPSEQYPIQDLPRDHVVFRTLFDLLEGVPQVPSINFWLGTGGATSERGSDSSDLHARGIGDDRGHMMVFMTHNTDISDSQIFRNRLCLGR